VRICGEVLSTGKKIVQKYGEFLSIGKKIVRICGEVLSIGMKIALDMFLAAEAERPSLSISLQINLHSV